MLKPDSLLLGTTLPPPRTVLSQNSDRGGSAASNLYEYHFPMVNDEERNRAFGAALRRAVIAHEPRLTLDIGCGSGLLALLAARAGAQAVVGLEMTVEMAEIAQQIVRQHGLEQR